MNYWPLSRWVTWWAVRRPGCCPRKWTVVWGCYLLLTWVGSCPSWFSQSAGFSAPQGQVVPVALRHWEEKVDTQSKIHRMNFIEIHFSRIRRLPRTPGYFHPVELFCQEAQWNCHDFRWLLNKAIFTDTKIPKPLNSNPGKSWYNSEMKTTVQMNYIFHRLIRYIRKHSLNST